MGALTLHPMKEIRVIVAGEHRAFVTELLDRVKRPATRSSAMYPAKAITACVRRTSCSASRKASR